MGISVLINTLLRHPPGIRIVLMFVSFFVLFLSCILLLFVDHPEIKPNQTINKKKSPLTLEPPNILYT